VISYRVKSGDVLGTIARRHGVSVRELRSWNNLRGDVIRVGQRLYIHADPR
jgi:membrane-bound lytic murein transglycosylase D